MSLREDSARNYRPAMQVPFTLAEYKERANNIKKEMERENIDLLYCTSPVSLFYISGYQTEWYQGEDPEGWDPLAGIFVQRESEEILFFDRPREEVITHTHTLGVEVMVRTYEEESKISELEYILLTLKEKGWLKGRVGLEMLSHRPNPLISAKVKSAFEQEGCEVLNGSNVVRTVRAVKSPQELAYHRVAGKLADIGIQTAIEVLKPGMKEQDVLAEILYSMTKAGSEWPGIPMPVLSGSRSACAHALTGQNIIMPGDIVMVDVCGVFKRYHTNTCRTFCIGEPEPEILQMTEAAVGAWELVGEMIKPGMVVSDFSRELRNYYMESGVWDHRRWMGGYELGPAFPPSWIGSWKYEIEEEGDNRVIPSGTTMNFEAQIYLPLSAGFFMAVDTIEISKDRSKIMSKFPPNLIVIEERASALKKSEM